MRQASRLIILLIASLSLVACLGPVKADKMASYALTGLPLAKNYARGSAAATLLVSQPIAGPGYGTADMLYMNVPFKLRSFAANRWVAPPAQMILPLLGQRIRAQRYFRAVVTAPFSGLTNYRLDTQLIALRQEFLQPNSQIRLIMQATLVKNSSNRIMASRRFQVIKTAQQNNPYGGVIAANQAVATMDRQIAAFVTRSVR